LCGETSLLICLPGKKKGLVIKKEGCTKKVKGKKREEKQERSIHLPLPMNFYKSYGQIEKKGIRKDKDGGRRPMI